MPVSPCVVGTWPFSRNPVFETMQLLCNENTSIDAVEKGINLAELDASYGPYHIGCAGWQNSEFVLELDAAIMNGADLNFGAVTALKGFPQAISVARRVMERSQHSMLTGEVQLALLRHKSLIFNKILEEVRNHK
uniref:Uncharacterized protein n=2 Tax=Arion vulgaris TaxID=1028688 RepID=A0A0B7B187_9EUPU